MPHLDENTIVNTRASNNEVHGVESSSTWICGGRKATTLYMNRDEVRKAIHVGHVKEMWSLETDMRWTPLGLGLGLGLGLDVVLGNRYEVNPLPR